MISFFERHYLQRRFIVFAALRRRCPRRYAMPPLRHFSDATPPPFFS